jgi:hypothetical protein
VPASALFLQEFGFCFVEQVDETEADEEIKVGGGKVYAAADLGCAADSLVQMDDRRRVHCGRSFSAAAEGACSEALPPSSGGDNAESNASWTPSCGNRWSSAVHVQHVHGRMAS